MGGTVQYFYEPFLGEFDPELRKNFGVWCTPPEIVRYMVGSVDAALQENSISDETTGQIRACGASICHAFA